MSMLYVYAVSMLSPCCFHAVSMLCVHACCVLMLCPCCVHAVSMLCPCCVHAVSLTRVSIAVSMVCAVSNGVQQLAVNEQALRRAWESSQRSTKEDWAEWMRHFAVELLKESPSHALRATHLLAQVWPRSCVEEEQVL